MSQGPPSSSSLHCFPSFEKGPLDAGRGTISSPTEGMHTHISGLYVPGVSIHSIILDLIIKNPVVQLSSTIHSFKNPLIHSFSFLGFSKCGPRSLHKSHPLHLTMLYKSAHSLSVVSSTSTRPFFKSIQSTIYSVAFYCSLQQILKEKVIDFPLQMRENSIFAFLVRLLHQIITWKAFSPTGKQPAQGGDLSPFHAVLVPWFISINLGSVISNLLIKYQSLQAIYY